MKFQKIPFESLKDKIIKNIKINTKEDEILFIDSDDKKYLMWHDQDFNERMYIENICGDLDDILNSPILFVDETIIDNKESHEKFTFYRLATTKGSVTVRWCGEYNSRSSVSFGVEI
jgi:hypothetical protein